MKIRDLIAIEDTTSASVGKIMTAVGSRPRRKRKSPLIVYEWKTTPVHGDPDKWQVKVGKRWVTGVWRTVSGRHMFFKDGGGTLPTNPKGFKRKKIGENMEKRSIRDILQGISDINTVTEAAVKMASKQVVELIAADMVDAPKVQRRVMKILGDDADTSSMIESLIPAVVHWLEKQGVKVSGASAAQRDLRSMAKE